MQLRRSAGQGIVEYGLILGGGVLVMLVVLVFLGRPLSDVISFITDLIDQSG